MAASLRYASILVHVDLGPDAEARVALAGRLADRFNAHLIGAAAAEPWLPASGDPGMGMDPGIIDAYRQMVADDLAAAETAFRRAVGARADMEWRTADAPPAAHLREQARAADLLVLGREGDGDGRWHLRVAPDDVVMTLGRPVLVVPPGVRRLDAERIVVGWKNSAQARRALWDGLPLLAGAQEAIVVCAGDAAAEGLSDAVAHLRRHGVRATPVAVEAAGADPADTLIRTAEKEGADLIVAGAYGHARLREWILGGVTRDLLDRAPVCCLMSH